MKDAVFDWWAPVLRYEMEHGAPRLLVLMGGNTRDQVNRLRLAGHIPLDPSSVTITHYSFRAKSADRVAAYDVQFDQLRDLAAGFGSQ